ncbi:MAG: tetraacyldisaccharide 4'-kinase, partial [Rhodobacteraceae bacterium]|nr:tetraacyldisaccharide 4'-kinase [Paracoccaceae bacterium]
GHQNLTLEPTLSIIVVDAVRGFGNKRVIPSGPLREPLSQALARVDMVVAVGTETQVERLQNHFGKDYDLPVIPARLTLLESGLSLDSQNVVAFAGIGDPSKFRATLNELGTNVIKFVPLDDHEVPAESFLLRLEGEARKSNALLITTEKDAVRLNPDWKKKVLTVPIRLELNDWDLFDTYFQSKAEGFVNSD